MADKISVIPAPRYHEITIEILRRMTFHDCKGAVDYDQEKFTQEYSKKYIEIYNMLAEINDYKSRL